MIELSAAELAARDAYKLMIGIIVPRAIAFVSTISAAGQVNLAPFSFFTGVGQDPPMLCFSIIARKGQPKDTLRNIEQTREFVVCSVSEEIASQMNLTSGDYPPDNDEFAIAGLTAAPSVVVRPPRVAESLTAMECKLHQIVTVGNAPSIASIVIGEIVHFRIAEQLYQAGRVDQQALHAIGRMAGDGYSRTNDQFELKRPVV